MTIQQQFAKAFSPDRWEILGRRLNHYSAGHHQLLSQFDSNDSGPAELITAVQVCSLTFEEAEQYLYRGGWSFWALRALLAMQLRPNIFYTASEMFRAYVEEARRHVPNFWSDPKQTTESACPETAMLLRDLPLRYSESEILNMPIAKAHWLRLVAMEQRGAVDFIDDDIIERAKAMAREVAEAEAANRG